MQLDQPEQKDFWVHETAQVEEGAFIGLGSKVWNNSQVKKGAVVGKNCVIGHNCFVNFGAKLGDGVKLESNIDVWELVELEDYVFVGPSAVFTNDPNPRAKYPKSKFPEYGKWRPTLIKKGASLGANCTIVCGNTVGVCAFVGAGSVVTHNVPDYAIVAGNPAKIIGWMCECGNKLNFENKAEDTCLVCAKRYQKVEEKVSQKNMKFLDLSLQYQSIKLEIDKAVQSTLDSCQFIGGTEVENFEKEIAEYCQAKEAVSVNSGTDGLFLSLKALGIGDGDEVITTPFTFVATAEAIANAGARPVFADIDLETFNIDPKEIEKKITNKTKAIIPVHLFGQIADMEAIMALAKKYNLKVIEDAAQAIGAKSNGRRAGSFGDCSCFSFFPSKNLGGFGDGGMITTNQLEVAQNIKSLRSHGSSPQEKYLNLILGVNSRLDGLQASILRVKLKYLEEWNSKRASKAEYYSEGLKDISSIKVPLVSQEKHIFHQYTIRAQQRDALKDFLGKAGIPTMIYYFLPLHLQPVFSGLGYKEGDFPQAEKASQEVLSLPIFPELLETEQDEVIKKIKEFFIA
ncbi:MAG: aminotransferase class V-fold PLP-dependent enzyme [bacterium]